MRRRALPCAVVPMIGLASGEVDFEVLVYGYSARELCRVPPPDPIRSLARRYPEHTSSPLLLRDYHRRGG